METHGKMDSFFAMIPVWLQALVMSLIVILVPEIAMKVMPELQFPGSLLIAGQVLGCVGLVYSVVKAWLSESPSGKWFCFAVALVVGASIGWTVLGFLVH
ncbi:hypothetical protein [Ralstonia chuxiongensis]|uniref:Transmembrane protein n=1 Tax=Ralstonia chuxiongensis TaxID=2957504 RepID=A0AA42BJW8_9RALS|nr:hypothetical protein [Ralstonia chuxiongensis]MCP1175635.1 hypothetical protein [Ralstonia chuxiongensis]